MPYDVVSYGDLPILPSSSMTQIFSNMASIAVAESGTPTIVNSAIALNSVRGGIFTTTFASFTASQEGGVNRSGPFVLNDLAFFPNMRWDGSSPQISQRRPTMMFSTTSGTGATAPRFDTYVTVTHPTSANFTIAYRYMV